MEGHRPVLLLLSAAALLTLAGPGCAWLNRPPPPSLPRALWPSPTLEDVIQVVNNNSRQITSFSTDEARLSVPGIPSLRASVAFERPKRLRLRAETGLTGPELDVGSNDELFWIWVKSQPPMYSCRHDQFAASSARQVLPIEPEWLIEALGITELDPIRPHQAPTAAPGGRLEIRTAHQTPDGPATKVTLVDAVTGVVTEQHLFDARGQLVARALASHHRRDPLTNLIMPRIVDISCPRLQFSMRIDLGNVQINRPLANRDELWAMPNIPGCPIVDLGDPDVRLAPVGPPLPPPATPPAAVPSEVSARLLRPRRAGNRLLR